MFRNSPIGMFWRPKTLDTSYSEMKHLLGPKLGSKVLKEIDTKSLASPPKVGRFLVHLVDVSIGLTYFSDGQERNPCLGADSAES